MDSCELRDLDGKYIPLHVSPGQRLLVVFIQPDCLYSRSILRAVDAAGAASHDGGPTPILISFGDLPANRRLAAEYCLRCPVLLQDAAEVAERYGVIGTPSALMLNEQGEVLGTFTSGAAGVLGALGMTPVPLPGPPDWAEQITPYTDAGDWLEFNVKVRATKTRIEESLSVHDHRVSNRDRNQPLVSVVMATRDRPSFLRMALDCYRRQTYGNSELIVVDDGGEFPADPRAVVAAGGRVIRVPEGTPLGTKMNIGVEEARGELCQKWDDDDFYAPNFLNALTTAMLDRREVVGDAAIGYMTRRYWFDLIRWQMYEWESQGFIGATLQFRRKDWRKTPFRDIRLSEDGWFLIDQLKRGVTPVPVDPSDLFLFVRHGEHARERSHAWNRIGVESVEQHLRHTAKQDMHPEIVLPSWALERYRSIRRNLTLVRRSGSRLSRTEREQSDTLGKARPNLLFLSPVVPAFTGGGTQIHAGIMLQALTSIYRVYMIVVPTHRHDLVPMPEEISALCTDWAIIPPVLDAAPPMLPCPSSEHGRGSGDVCPAPRFWTRASAETCRDVFEEFGDITFDAIHVHRLHMTPFAQRFIESRQPPPELHVDLDEVESVNRTVIARLNAEIGNTDEADLYGDEARRYELAEAVILPRCTRIYVASEAERIVLERRFNTDQVIVLPNAMILPAVPPLPPTTSPFTFLFVGTFGYIPNEDAIRYLCSTIVPLIRRGADRPLQILVLGRGDAPPDIRDACARAPEVELVGEVPELLSWYERSHAVIVPLRAGTGTRIKIVEAMAHGRPIVTTSIGMEGLEMQAGIHALVGDTAESFAAHCLSLMRDADERERLGLNGRQLCERVYSPDALVRCLAALKPEIQPVR
ncbi:MAG: hypothetical protein PVSMB7_22280 [Chloroflexota bacterium]